MSTEGNRRRRARREQGFELNPARCINCNNYQPPIHGVPVKRAIVFNIDPPRKHYVPARCKVGDFEVLPHSICDKWAGKNGEVLA